MRVVGAWNLDTCIESGLAICANFVLRCVVWRNDNRFPQNCAGTSCIPTSYIFMRGFCFQRLKEYFRC